MAQPCQCCSSVSFKHAVALGVEAVTEELPCVASTAVHRVRGATTDRDDELPVDGESVAEAVRAHYASRARFAAAGDPNAPQDGAIGGIGASVYEGGELGALPEHIVASSVGCANPVAIAELRAGDIVLDLGSGGGLDVLLSARRVGPTGRAYGLDMTDEMLELARQSQAEAEIDNAEFLQGRIEAIPLPDHSIDVVLSNCVIGLSPDKDAVFAETYRVLRPGGRLAVADVVARAQATTEQQAVVENWVSCLAGSLTRSQYSAVLQGAGFVGISIEESHRVAEGFDSVIVRATKPGPQEPPGK